MQRSIIREQFKKEQVRQVVHIQNQKPGQIVPTQNHQDLTQEYIHGQVKHQQEVIPSLRNQIREHINQHHHVLTANHQNQQGVTQSQADLIQNQVGVIQRLAGVTRI